MKNLYKIITTWDGSNNFDHYFVTATNGYLAGAWLNAHVLAKRNGKKKKREEINEIELVGPIDFEA